MSLPTKTTHISGLQGSARAWFIAERFKKRSAEKRRLLILCPTREESELLFSDLQFFLPIPPRHLPAWDVLPFEQVSPQLQLMAERLATLYAMTNDAEWVVVTSVDAVTQKLLPAEIINALTFRSSVGQITSLRDIETKALAAGYQKVSLVEEKGEIAVRGAVIDIYPADSATPVRIEVTDGKVERIKLFDPESQRTNLPLNTVLLTPVRERIILSRHAEIFPSLKEDQILEALKKRGRENETPPREIVKILSAVRKSEEDQEGLELLLPFFVANLSPLFGFLPSGSSIICVDDLACSTELEESYVRIKEREERLRSEHYLIPSPNELYLSLETVESEIKNRTSLTIDGLTLSNNEVEKRRSISTSTHLELVTKLKTKIGTGEAFEPLIAAITKWRKQGFEVAFVVGSLTRAEKLQRLLLASDLDAPIAETNGADWLSRERRDPLVILQGYLSQGITLEDEKLVFIGEQEIFAERSYRRSKQSRVSLKKLMNSLAQLQDNDYVVHVDFGIGIYRGLTHREIEGSESDFLHIEYADSTLYLPVQNIGKVQKFTAAEGQKPILDRLGSNRWIKTKEKIKQAVIPLAADLIRLYASRSVAKGWRYEPHGAEDERFADEFAYNETPDQQKAIEDTLQNMADDKPMDRLVCGDVGFGKTEVAIRAAFKAAQHRKQVAILVPTTLLVDQHERTFRNRFNGYPFKIAAMSRFRSPQQNKQTIEGLATHDVDIVIGTHKLLQRDIRFADLGLLIIDEEHRFGVKQKEMIKSIKKNIDVLTLTATPIPRTLHMSLLGIRDISVISTPPMDRRLIRTCLANYDDGIIRDAILREIQRGGQAYYVHNRVQSIDIVTAALAELVPEARFRFAHGQMSEEKLEEIMRDFIDRKIDVLVSTTIIESGIDIPNANTMIIERADTYGLAQLYQLRGRVGRSDQQAYAYFLVPKKKLGGEASKRLKALQSLDDLGLGFNLAMRDLEIRGAGNLLGKEQSGSVLAVGFELYSKILKEAVLHLKGEEMELEETIDPEVKLGINAFIPEWYIPDISERLVLYQRLSAVRSSDEMNELVAEIEDRFGPIGSEVFDLVELMRFRSLLRRYGVVRAELKNMQLQLALSPQARVDAEKIFEVVKKQPTRIKFGKNLTITLNFESLRSPSEVYRDVQNLLSEVGAGETRAPLLTGGTSHRSV